MPAAFGNQLFDYGALYTSLWAVGAHVDPLLVLLAFVAASALAMIPLTPGGLGFVEGGLIGVLTLAGVSPEHAVVGTLLYRLFSYWLPLPAGVIASYLFSRYHRRAGTRLTSSPVVEVGQVAVRRWSSRSVPAQRDARPDELDDTERPRPGQEAVDARQHAAEREAQYVALPATFQRVHDHHEGHRADSVDRDGHERRSAAACGHEQPLVAPQLGQA